VDHLTFEGGLGDFEKKKNPASILNQNTFMRKTTAEKNFRARLVSRNK